jgi:transmembrane sensor
LPATAISLLFMTTHYLSHSAKEFSIDDAFIHWVLSGEEDAAWQNWLQQHPEKRAEVEEAKLLVTAFHQAQEEDTTAQINKVWDAIQQSLGQAPQPKVIGIGKRLKAVLRVAAVILLVAGAAVTSLTLYQRSQTITYATAYGETKTVTLPDGSSVMLNANSEISFKKSWEKNTNRDVGLKGEAYFSVQHLKNNQPFIVHVSDKINIRVLGTEFNVSNRHDDVKILLNKGRIQLEQTLAGTKNTLVMKPGDLVEEVANNQLKKQSLQAIENKEVLAWKEQKIDFENAGINELKNWLKDNHNITLLVQDTTLQNIHFNGEFPADDWKILIAALETAYHQKATYNGNEVTLTSK